MAFSRLKFSRKSSLKLLLACLVLLGLFFWFIHRTAPTLTPMSAAPQVPQVTVTPIALQTVARTVNAYAHIFSAHSAQIASQINGVVVDFKVSPGQVVKQGQLLVVIHATDPTMQPSTLRAQMLASKAHYLRYATANRELAGTVADDMVETAKAQFQQDQASYQAAIAATQVRAPRAGTVTATSLAAGSSVQVGTVLLSVVTADNLQLEYSLPSQYIRHAHTGQAVSFRPNSEQHIYTGKVSYVAPQLHPQGGGFQLRATLVPSAGLQPNHFGELTQVLDPHARRLVIPQILVHTDTQGFYVYSVATGKVIKLYFTPGNITAKGMVVVQKGIAAGRQMIVSDVSHLAVGQRVRVIAAAPKQQR